MKPRHWLVFAFLGIIWSSSFLWIKLALREIGPAELVTYRMIFAAISATLVVLLGRKPWPRDLPSWGALALLGLVNLALPNLLISWGEQTIDSAVAAILNATVPLFTTLIAHSWLHDDKMTSRRITGLVAGFAGVVVLLSEDLAASAHGSLLGQGAVVLASFLYGASNVFARRHTKEIDGLIRGAVPPMFASIFMIGVGSVSGGHFPAPPTLPLTWVAVLWLGILGSAISMIFHYYLLHEIGPTRTSMVAYVFPLGGMILGVVFMQESLSWQLLAGSILIISGIVVVNRPQEERRVTAGK
jgi:drug/metabolite transporter (DMT)-like permease